MNTIRPGIGVHRTEEQGGPDITKKFIRVINYSLWVWSPTLIRSVGAEERISLNEGVGSII